jgi:hypothetical protein
MFFDILGPEDDNFNGNPGPEPDPHAARGLLRVCADSSCPASPTDGIVGMAVNAA